LRQYAQSLGGVTIHFETEFVSLLQTTGGVAAQLRDINSGRTATVRSSYLIGADGARSAVRDAIGATMIGEGAFSRNFSIIFRAPDLASRQIHGPAIMYWMVNEEMPSLLGPMNEAGLWTFMVTKLFDNVDPATMDPIDLIRRGTGLRDLDIEIVGTDLWVAHRLVADAYSRGRVFLAGDACHLHPPFGGFGMNMGIGDAVDLGWKMSARLGGWGGDNLLAAYETERRPVHDMTSAAFAVCLLASSTAFAAETVTLAVQNMYCAVCPHTVKASLEAVRGVAKVAVSYQDKTAIVTYDDSKTDVKTLTDATTSAGYPSAPKG
jgi:mercuric transport protein